jgi:CRISPR-associated endonuclease Cas1
MQKDDTPGRQPLAPSRDGVLFVSGFATSLRVERGHLTVRTGEGRDIREGRFSRVSHPRIRRVLIYGKGGYTTWSALEWIEGIGASFALVSRDGGVVACSAEAGPNQPALRRAQVAAAETEVGLQILKELLTSKLEGQLALVRRLLPRQDSAAQALQTRLGTLANVGSTASAVGVEAKAASAYWAAWRDVRMHFARADKNQVPKHWLTFGDRHSPLSTSPKKASTPAGAILNYLYALAEFECRLALLAVGLDPGLGWAHRDAPYRDSAALDLLEALRPAVDEHVMGLLSSRTFSRREFAELPTGQVRLMPALARHLAASTLPSWERIAPPHAERIARTLAKWVGGGIRVPSSATRGARGKGRATMSRRSAKVSHTPSKIPSACRECGVVLNDPERQYCRDCLPKFKEQHTDKLVKAARQVLAEMRASADDPSRSPEAVAKRVKTNSERRKAALAWERKNPGPHDPEMFRSEILPTLGRVTLPQMMRATGLTSGYCWKIRRGERIPHPMYWASLRAVARTPEDG